jgi:hypothetical protein
VPGADLNPPELLKALTTGSTFALSYPNPPPNAQPPLQSPAPTHTDEFGARQLLNQCLWERSPSAGNKLPRPSRHSKSWMTKRRRRRATHQTGRATNIGADLVRLPAPCGGRDTACHHPPPSRREGNSGRSDAGARRRQAPSPRGIAAGAQVGSRSRPLDLIAAREPQWCMAQTQSGRRTINPSPRAIRSIRPRCRRKIGRSGLSVRKARFLMEPRTRSSAHSRTPRKSRVMIA